MILAYIDSNFLSAAQGTLSPTITLRRQVAALVRRCSQIMTCVNAN